MIFLFVIFFLPFNVFASDTARSSILMDVDSGRILYNKNMNEKRLIASITKIMTAVVAIENSDINKRVKAGEEVLSMYGTSIYIESGEEMSIKDLLYGLILRSGNDAAVVIAKAVSKDEKSFVKLMNETAARIGMKNTVFHNCHGLDEETQNYSTAYDMAILSRYIYNKSSIYRKIINTYKYSVVTDEKSYLWYNRNELLKRYKYCVGGKTGYTPKAGKTLVSVATKNNFTVTAVSIKDPNHYNSQKELYEYIFAKYQRYKIIDKDHFSIDEDFYQDELYIKDDFFYPLTEDEFTKIKTLVKITKLKNYKNNDKVGQIEVKLDGKVIKTLDVFVRKNKKKSFFSSLFRR